MKLAVKKTVKRLMEDLVLLVMFDCLKRMKYQEMGGKWNWLCSRLISPKLGLDKLSYGLKVGLCFSLKCPSSHLSELCSWPGLAR